MAINIRYTGAMDIKIKTATMNFHYCARAIIKQDEKVLLIQVNDAGYYHLPGGHVAIGETTKQVITENSIRREQGPDQLIKNELRWVTLAELKNLDFRPERIKNLIIKNEFKTLQHIIG